jgi:sterol desaturase/sphingolipid hydroxylase (fatty acid hydroxylase superfamily)
MQPIAADGRSAILWSILKKLVFRAVPIRSFGVCSEAGRLGEDCFSVRRRGTETSRMSGAFGIPHLDYIAISGIFVLFGCLEYFLGVYDDSKRRSDDYWLEIVCTLQFMLYKPLIVLCVGTTLQVLIPSGKDVWRDMSIWFMLVCIVVGDDLVQYWYHRLAHHSNFFWKLHRAHHSAPEMGFTVTYRNAMLYFLLMPNLWIGAILIYAGMGIPFVLYSIVKLAVVMAAHSETRWDRALYRYRLLHPVAWVIERTISTPATHFAHHGLSEKDGISCPNGNFSNMFFIWDVIFGTAHITRRYPEQFGVATERGEPWTVQLYYPFCRSKDDESELR